MGTFRNTNVENQETNETRSQDDPHPEVGSSVYQSRHSNDSNPDKAPHSNSLSYPLDHQGLLECQTFSGLDCRIFVRYRKFRGNPKKNKKSKNLCNNRWLFFPKGADWILQNNTRHEISVTFPWNASASCLFAQSIRISQEIPNLMLNAWFYQLNGGAEDASKSFIFNKTNAKVLDMNKRQRNQVSLNICES